MQIDALTLLSKAIEAAIDAVAIPALIFVAVAVLVMAAEDIARLRRRRAVRTRRTVSRTHGGRARGAEV